MALHDENGRITIDEVAAQNDVRRLLSAVSALENAKASINNLVGQAAEGQGQTMLAVMDKAVEMRGNIQSMIDRLKETISFIQNTVTHYQRLDQQVKAAIEAAQDLISVLPADRS